MKKAHSWQHFPHPGPDPERTLTLRDLLSEIEPGTVLALSQGRLPPKAVPRNATELADELAAVLVEGEVFRRAWWSLRVELRDTLWRLLEPVYREGGVLKVKDIKEMPPLLEIADLEAAGLLFALPSPRRPERLAFPYEYFFMPDMPGTGPQSLCQGLRHYSDAGARVLAAELGLREVLPRAATLARLHRGLISNASRLATNLNPQAAALLEAIASRGGVVATRALSARLAALRPDWALRQPLAADDLVGARFNPNSPAQHLARRGLLVPCGEPGWSAFPQACVPEELRDEACGATLEKARATLAAERKRLGGHTEAPPDERPGQFATDLARLEMVSKIERIRPAAGGRLARSARKRLEPLLHLTGEELDALLEFAARRGGEEGVDAFLALKPADQARALAEDFLGPPGWHRDFRGLLVGLLGSLAKGGYAAPEAVARFLSKDPAAVACYEAAHPGGEGPAEEPWLRARTVADLRALHRLGFAQRASGAPQEAYRLSPAAWPLTGKKPPASATRAPRSAPPSEAGFAVLPTMEILASPAVGLPLLQALSRFARLERADAAFVFRVDRKSLAAGVNSGQSPGEILEFLEKGSKNPVPETVRFLLSELDAGAARVTLDAKGKLLRTTDPMVLLRLRRVKWLKPWIVEGDSPAGTLRLAPEADHGDIARKLSKEGFVLAR